MMTALLVLIIYIVTVYNGMAQLLNATKKSFAMMDVVLKKRHDLVSNLIASVKNFMVHETSLFENIIELRAMAMTASGSEKIGAEAQLGAAVGMLNLSIENYPDFQSDKIMLQLQASLRDVEEEISALRIAYNASVNSYNNKIEAIPGNALARVLGFEAAALFEATETERRNVDVG